MRGLLGRRPSWLGADGVLILSPCNSVHTFGMKQPIDIAFIDTRGCVLKSLEGVAPRRIVKCPQASITLERFTPESLSDISARGVANQHSDWIAQGSRLYLEMGQRS